MGEIVIKAKKMRGEDGYKVFSIRIPESLVQQLEKACNESGYSRNELITVLIENGLKDLKIEP